jgi:hypothetical protein
MFSIFLFKYNSKLLVALTWYAINYGIIYKATLGLIHLFILAYIFTFINIFLESLPIPLIVYGTF